MTQKVPHTHLQSIPHSQPQLQSTVDHWPTIEEGSSPSAELLQWPHNWPLLLSLFFHPAARGLYAPH